MEPTERPFVHSKDSDATSWLRALLERLGAPASASAEMITAAAVSTTGALRDLRSRPEEWGTFLGELSGTLASVVGCDCEDARQTLLEKIDKELIDVQVKRERTDDAAGSKDAQFAAATSESHELLRTRQWCSRQPIVVPKQKIWSRIKW